MKYCSYELICTGCDDISIRLPVHTSNSGLIEMCFGRQWLSVCTSKDTWTDELAELACVELGLPFKEARGTVKQYKSWNIQCGIELYHTAYTATTVSQQANSTDAVVFLRNCSENYTHLGECDTTKRTSCTPPHHAGIICSCKAHS